MHRPAVATTTDTVAANAAMDIIFRHISGILVSSSQGCVIGFVSEADFLPAILDGNDLQKLTSGTS